MHSGPLSLLSVEELVLLAQQGDKAATERLLQIYEPKIQQIASNYYFVGYERHDVIQEARLSFWDAILNYNRKKQTNFEYFARICINKQLISKIKTATKCRNKPLNEGESLETPVDSSDPDGLSRYDTIPDETVNIEEDVIAQYEAQWLDENLKKRLTDLERTTYEKYNEGYTYREIATKLRKTEKTIDNAIMRVRNKAKDVTKQYITNILVKEEECSIEDITKKYGWADIDDMISSFYNGVFHLDNNSKKIKKNGNVKTNK